jgi:ribose 5-phosphate isomerase B
MKIAVGSDHAGYALKEEIVQFLANNGLEFEDFGVHSAERADYPDIGLAVAENVAAGSEYDRGILVCGSGIGMSIAANKVPGIRAALCESTYTARFSRLHNNSNILVLGGRILGVDIALDILSTWLETSFPGEERHAKRIAKIADIEKKYTRGGR